MLKMKRWQWAGYPVGGLLGACMGIVALYSFAEITHIQPLQISAGIGAIFGILLMTLLLSHPFRMVWVKGRRLLRRIWKHPVFFNLKEWFVDFICFLRWMMVPNAIIYGLATLQPVFDSNSPSDATVRLWVEFAGNLLAPFLLAIPAMIVCPNRGARRRVGAYVLLVAIGICGLAMTHEIIYGSSVRTQRELCAAFFLGLACAVWITRYSTRKCQRTSITSWVRTDHGDSSVIAKF